MDRPDKIKLSPYSRNPVYPPFGVRKNEGLCLIRVEIFTRVQPAATRHATLATHP